MNAIGYFTAFACLFKPAGELEADRVLVGRPARVQVGGSLSGLRERLSHPGGPTTAAEEVRERGHRPGFRSVATAASSAASPLPWSEQDRAGALGGISLAGLSFVLRWRKLNRSRSARPFSGLLSRVSR
jgi:hypothetical protein